MRMFMMMKKIIILFTLFFALPAYADENNLISDDDISCDETLVTQVKNDNEYSMPFLTSNSKGSVDHFPPYNDNYLLN